MATERSRMAIRLPLSTQQVLEPLLQSIPLTELRPLLKDATLRQYANARLPERVARLQRYNRSPPLDAVVLAVQEGDLDIADEITNAERDSFSFLIQVATRAVSDRNLALVDYVIDTDPNGQIGVGVIRQIISQRDSKFLTSVLERHRLVNVTLFEGTKLGDLPRVQYAIAHGAVAIDVAIAVATEVVIHYARDAREAHSLYRLSADTVSDIERVGGYLNTIQNKMPLDVQMFAFAREIYSTTIFDDIDLRTAIEYALGYTPTPQGVIEHLQDLKEKLGYPTFFSRSF